MYLNHTVYPLLNVFPSCKVVFSLEKNKKIIYPPFGMHSYLHRKIILKGNPIIYALKKKYICGYNPRCFVSSGLLFDNIIVNMIRNKELECHKKEVD